MFIQKSSQQTIKEVNWKENHNSIMLQLHKVLAVVEFDLILESLKDLHVQNFNSM